MSKASKDLRCNQFQPKSIFSPVNFAFPFWMKTPHVQSAVTFIPRTRFPQNFLLLERPTLGLSFFDKIVFASAFVVLVQEEKSLTFVIFGVQVYCMYQTSKVVRETYLARIC